MEREPSTSTRVRIGADKSSPDTIINEELHFEEDEPLVITEKMKIKWRRRNFETLHASFENGEDDYIGPLMGPVHYFLRYINECELEKMAKYTNIYALQNSKHNFKPTNVDEIKSLVELNIAIGTLHFPRVRLYWNKALGVNLFLDTMTRDRFFQLRSNLHLVNNLERTPTSSDKLAKVRPLYNAIRKRCLELKQAENLCIDEQMVLSEGS